MNKSLLYVFIAAFLVACTVKEEKKLVIEQWRGENRDGKYQENNLLKTWPEEGPELLWFYEDLEGGYGSPVISDEEIYILASRDSVAAIVALDLEGKLKWQKDFGFAWNSSYPGSRSTPTLVGDLLYVSSGKGEIACIKIENSEIVWTKNMLTDFHGNAPYFGYAQSLLINDELVYAMPGGVDTNIVALNRFNGDLIWTSKASGEKPAFNSPRLIDINSRQVLVTYSEKNFLGVDATTGQLLWSESFTPEYPNHANTILYDDGSIYTASAKGHGLIKYKISADASSISQIWQDTIIGNYFGGMIMLGDKLYTGAGGRSKYLLRLNANTGEILDSLETGNGSIIYADGMLYNYGQKNGKVSLIDAESFEIKGSLKVDKGTKEHFSHPVIKNGVLYIRHGNTLLAYDIKLSSLDE